MNNGEIRWYTFKPPDKKRPVVILTRSPAIKFLGEVTIAPITTTIRDIPTEVLLDEQDGMKTTCVVNLDHIQTVSKDKIGIFISRLSKRKMFEIKQAILFCFGFNKQDVNLL
ncbi:type II toxin-antitoxin system PemK/MazF family toxin [candidate division KSB1 bacterium]|nr:type II toxin-antitoxin system PemK/MazF family toxin [candidate division KSB1 bacterium]MBL7093037.1 type II toxin-antitoxin system PemK/MazF family toxin [candidate division KSB1 bacterium]